MQRYNLDLCGLVCGGVLSVCVCVCVCVRTYAVGGVYTVHVHMSAWSL